MSYILGLTGPVSYDQSAVLLDDGKIIAAAEEERFSGLKHHRFGPPVKAVEYCLKEAGVKPSDLDSIAVGWGSQAYWIKSIAGFIARRPFMFLNLPTYVSHLGRYWRPGFLKGFAGGVRYYRHHLAHPASAFYCSGFRESNIISIDECGETESAVLAVGDGLDIEVVRSFNYLNSLGRLYRQFTEYLGFIGNCDEYKVMGLAAYGKPLSNTGHLMRLYSNGYSLETRHFYWSLVKNTVRRIDKMLEVEGSRLDLDEYLGYGPSRKAGGEITGRHRNVAATVQDIYERVLIHLAALLYSQTGCKKFCIAGGCGLNCVANGRLLQQDFVDDVFVQPAASDAGSSLGAALLEAREGGELGNRRLRDAGLGPSYTNEEIEKELVECRLDYEYHDDVEGVAAELLAQNSVVAWFQGRMEYGPRALGCRSILANPMAAESRDRVNKLKGRELWRPLAPSLLEECVGDYFSIKHLDDFMTVVQPVRPEKRSEIPAVVHVDGTTRYQTVGRQAGGYRRLIEAFNTEAGVPVVLNTSFNARGRPIVCTPSDAISSFRKLGLDGLVMGNLLVR
jgi:carbamoyltransferase